MAGGANKRFLEDGRGFLRDNVVLSPNPTVSHIHFQHAAGTRVDPGRINAYIHRTYAVGSKAHLRTLLTDRLVPLV